MNKIQCVKSTALCVGLMLPISGFAITSPPVENESFDDLFYDSRRDGACNVTRVEGVDHTFYIPTDLFNTQAKFNLVGWGNASGGNASTYSRLLESVASQCVLVAAANTGTSGAGAEIVSAVNAAKEQYSDILSSGYTLCTSGHYTGGTGAINAAHNLGADCVISIQPDTTFNATIDSPLSRDVEVITLWGELAGLAENNAKNVEDNTTILTQVTTAGDDFISILLEGSNIGIMYRMAIKAQLSNDASEASTYRQAFWGYRNEFTVTTSSDAIFDVDRNYWAIKN